MVDSSVTVHTGGMHRAMVVYEQCW